MESVTNNAPLIVVLGQTASGKSALAMKLALQFRGEIIAADSRTVYTGMNIGTAKPSVEDQKLVPHHLIDVVNPDKVFTVADFQRLANTAIGDITRRNKIPFVVGGSGLYIDALIYNFSFRKSGTLDRSELRDLSVGELQEMLVGRGIGLPENATNPRHLVRMLETEGEAPKRDKLRPRTLVIGLAKEKDDLEDAVRSRIDNMIANGFVDEVKRLSEKYGWDAPALQTPGYKEFRMYLAGQLSLDEAKQQFIRSHMQYAKRQKTWFKRNQDIIWISNPEEAVDLVTSFLNK